MSEFAALHSPLKAGWFGFSVAGLPSLMSSMGALVPDVTTVFLEGKPLTQQISDSVQRWEATSTYPLRGPFLPTKLRLAFGPGLFEALSAGVSNAGRKGLRRIRICRDNDPLVEVKCIGIICHIRISANIPALRVRRVAKRFGIKLWPTWPIRLPVRWTAHTKRNLVCSPPLVIRNRCQR